MHDSPPYKLVNFFKREVTNKEYAERKFVDLHGVNSGRRFQNLRITDCQFESCSLSLTKDPRRRSTIRNVHTEDCEASGCIINAAILQDVHRPGHGLSHR